MDIKEEIVKSLESLAESGELNRMIDKRVVTFLDDKVESIFRWSDFSKAFETKLQNLLTKPLHNRSYGFSGLDAKMFQIMTHESKFIVDEDRVNLHYEWAH